MIRRVGSTSIRFLLPERLVVDSAYFWRYVPSAFDGDNEVCWAFTGPQFDNGYGDFGGWCAHRVAFFVHYEEQPGKLIQHSCDNRICCNPFHLTRGTHKTNAEDRDRKGRHKPGPGYTRPPGVPAQKLTEGQATRIKYSKQFARILARETGVSSQTIHDIRQGRTWKDI